MAVSRAALVMTEANYACLPQLLEEHGIRAESPRHLNEFKVIECRKGKAAVLLSMTKPVHWRGVEDERQDKVVVAALGASLWRFWNWRRDHRLQEEILSLLRPYAWSPGGQT